MPKAAIAEVDFGRGSGWISGLISGLIRVFLDRFNLRQKLMLLVAPLLLMMLVLTAQETWRLARDNSELKRSVEVTQLAIINSQLVHELQKERGLTAGYLASAGQNFSSKLIAQRVLTDDAIAQRVRVVDRIRASLGENAGDNIGVDAAGRLVQQSQVVSLVDRTEFRQRVDQHGVGVSEAIGFYSSLNQALLATNLAYARQSSQPVLLRHFIAYDRLLQAKELAGIERALLSSSLSKQQFSVTDFQQFLTLVSGQKTQLKGFEQLLLAGEGRSFNQMVASRDFTAVVEFRQLVMKQHASGELVANPSDWFGLASERINRLKQLENQFAETMLVQIETLHSEGREALQFILISRLLVVVLAFLIARGISVKIRGQVNHLVTTMKAVSEDQDLGLRASLVGEDEMAQIAGHYNQVLDNFAQTISQINGSSEAMAMTSTQIATAVSHAETSMHEQQAETAEFSTAIQQTSANIEVVTDRMQHVAEVTDLAYQAAEEGLEHMDDAVSSIEAISDEVNSIEALITELYRGSENIVGVLDVIKSVSEQTNLLALNAAIEAARAGEHGRGFAVVSEEVRALAYRTQDSASEIEQMLSEFQRNASSANEIVSASNRTANYAVEQTRSLSTTLRDIEVSIGTIRDMNRDVAGASAEQAVACKQIADNVVHFSNNAEVTTTATREIIVASRQQSENVARLKQLARKFDSGTAA